MNANEARQKSIENQMKNDSIQQGIEWTNQEISKAINAGRRECVLNWNKRSEIETVKRHFEELGYKVGQFKPPQTTFYVRW